MKMYLISDNVDTKTGMRFAGVEGVVVHGRDEALKAIESALEDDTIGVLLITEKLGQIVKDKISEIKMNQAIPLVVEIPDRHGFGRQEDAITRYVREAIGLKI